MSIRTEQQRIIPQKHPALAKRVEDNLTKIEAICSSWCSKSHSFPQGFTYLGQFLAHDTVSREGERQYSWKLDLDSIYPPFSDLEKIDPDTGKFRTTPATKEKLEDLPRDSGGRKALIPDFRNDNHFIIAQLHLAILRFHNRIVDEVAKSSSHSHSRAENIFAQAKEYVTACIHRIAMDEFLEYLCDEGVYDALWRKAQPSVIYVEDDEPGLPFDISHAAGRFGHSLVREHYALNMGDDASPKAFASLLDLFKLSGEHNPKYSGVPTNYWIDWTLFFPNPHSPNGLAESIDPLVIEPLLVPPSPNMIEKILQAGVRKELPSGQVIAERIAEELKSQGIDHDNGNGNAPLGVTSQLRVQVDNNERKNALESLGFWDETPLWLFVLIEADGTPKNGLKLGPVGSVLILEGYKNSIRLPGGSSYSLIQTQFESSFPDVKPVRSMYDLLSQI